MVTYLFGAGASCNKLPMVSNMPQRMSDLISELDERIYKNYKSKSQAAKLLQIKESVEKFKNHLWSLKDTALVHSSIDTYFKKLWLTNNLNTYYTHKNTYIYYLFIEELFSGLPDMRYDTFISSLLEKKDDKIKLIKPINFMTWNYDMQFEKAMLQYISHNQTEIENLFNIIKLNGSLTKGDFFTLNQNYHMPGVKKDFIFEKIFKDYTSFNYTKTKPNFDSNLQFSWEKENANISSHHQLSLTERLVIIGYSFPFFNRNVDRNLFGEHAMPRLKKVYIQVDAKDIESVAMRFRSIRPNFTHDKMSYNKQPIEFITRVDQFFYLQHFNLFIYLQQPAKGIAACAAHCE